MKDVELRTRKGIGASVIGHALAASDDISARYDIDQKTGEFARPQHKLFGQCCIGRILVLNGSKGGVASAWMLRSMVESGIAPLAILLNRANPIFVQGAVFAGLPLLDGFSENITELIQTGDQLEVRPSEGLVRILGKAKEA